MVPVSSSRPAILGATILLGAVFTFSAWCAVAAIDPTPRKALQCERHEGVFREAAERSRRNPGPYPPSLCVLPDCRRATDRKGAPNRLAQAFRMPGRIRFQRFAPEARRARLHRASQHRCSGHVRDARESGGQASDTACPGHHGVRRRSRGERARQQPGAAGRKRHRGVDERQRDRHQGHRAAQGDCSGDLARRGLDGFYESQPLAGLCRDGSKRIAEFAIKNRLPTVTNTAAYIKEGLLAGYGPNIPDQYHRAAIYIDRVLKGAQPAELPVEQPMKLDLVINGRTALGLALPQSILLRAVEVV